MIHAAQNDFSSGPEHTEEVLISGPEIARMFGKTMVTVNGWFQKGWIEGYNPTGHTWYCTRADLEAFKQRKVSRKKNNKIG